ncbi:bifunctional [glutamine synthetase] adenylyltransferase/[glutamine synthetase]-adenylyl-L-tyrosine phosphorylase [Curvivirga sp.]|uniref:bifunctional [glutamine synthetase] adenylyltransferase/[glutamine synthetase]-adenylyl-L-tyrosine phosphorylase n=1 Tax=Curvivirga sp. TaxID=2856848 RepID=UPI003B5BBB4C
MHADFQKLDISTLPQIADHTLAENIFERWQNNLKVDGNFPEEIKSWFEDSALTSLIKGIGGCSPFLGNLLVRDFDFTQNLFNHGLEHSFKDILDQLRGIEKSPITEAETIKKLRIAKRHAAVLIAIADITENWSLKQVTNAISDLADHTIRVTTAFILHQMHNRGEITLPHPEDPNKESGFFVLGMGKLGSRELNYSSDVDLILLYEPAKIQAKDPHRLRQDFVRAARDLMRLMDSRTADGYVFRTDLRLRPDPGATPLAMTYMAAVTYYESLGQNWERAAMIKARPVAGDLELGAAFIEDIRPFVWRKSLDFAMIEDIHSIKRQIHAHKGGGEIAVLNHNIKIGRGGIREIEFFAQTQQLIWGGRQIQMRVKDTCSALQALTDLGHVTDDVCIDLTKAYHFLRKLEHRLQMIDDQQTQTLPGDEEGLLVLANFMGYKNNEELINVLLGHLRKVEAHYAVLFEESRSLGSDEGSLVFTGTDDDPATIENLQNMGYEQPERTCSLIRNWHRGRYRATRSERARQILTELLPTILDAFANTADPDEAFIRFDTFLEGLPSGVQIFSLFQINPQLLELVAEIMGEVPQSAGWLARRPQLLDAVLSSDFFMPVDGKEIMQAQLEGMLAQARDFQDILDITRRWTNDYKFRISVHIMRNLNGGEGISDGLTHVAEVGLNCLIPAVIKEFEQAHGTFETNNFAVLGFGKLGGRELQPGSDLDLVYVYDTGECKESNGDRPLSPTMYYIRLCQRITTAINAQSGEGRLYEVDGRLRPDGNAGAVATQLSTFEEYYRHEGEENKSKAWTWEHMALTRARPVFVTEGFKDRLEDTIQRALCQQRDTKILKEDIRTMRERIASQHPEDQRWAVKHYKGGIIDIEFIAQFIQLNYAHSHPELLSPTTAVSLSQANKAGLLSDDDTKMLITSLALWRNIQAVMRLTAAKPEKGESEIENRKRLLLRVSGKENFEELVKYMDQLSKSNRAILETYLG